ncbi:MAG TPA: helix-turn-helix domain-containing protein [Bacilli bacterium]
MKKRSLFYNYLISYLLIVSIPVIVLGFILYRNSVVQFQSEIASFNISKLTQAQTSIDNGISSLQQTAFQMSVDSKLAPYALDQGYKLVETSTLLRKYKAANPFIHEVFLYYRKSDILHSSTGSYSSDSFQQYMFNDSRWNKLYFLKKLTSAEHTGIYSSASDEDYVGNNTIAMFVPIPLYASKPLGVVGFIIRESVLTDIVHNAAGNSNGATYILDESGKFLAIDNRNLSIPRAQLTDLIRIHQNEGVYEFQYKDVPYSFLVVKSAKTKWNLISIVPKNQLFHRVQQMQSFIFFILVLVIVAAVATAVFLTRRNYAPIRRLLGNIGVAAHQGQQRGSIRGEWDVIHHTVNQTMEANLLLKSQLDDQGPLIKELMLTRLLEGKPMEEQELLNVRSLITGKGKKFTVAYIHFGSLVELDTHTRQALTNLIQTVSFEGGAGIGIELHHEDSAAFIVNLDNEADCKRRLAQKLLELTDGIKERFPVRPVIGVGGIYNEVTKIHRSYIEAKGVIQYFSLQDGNRVIYFDEFRNHFQEQFWYPLEEQVRLSQCLLHGDAPLAEESIRLLFRKITQKDLTLEMVRYIYYDIINMIIKTVNQQQAEGFDDDIRKLLQFRSAEQLEERLLAISLNLCNYVLEAKSKKNENMISEIRSYVDENYRAANISLEFVAEHFGMTSSYLSKVFKQEVNVAFSDYIKQLRIAEIKRNLVETDKSIKELVLEIGYWDIPSFTRTFKQITGMTPGDYRKQHR